MVGATQRTAIIVRSGSQQALVLHEGEQAGRFTVTRITSDSVDAVGPGGPITLHVAATTATAQPDHPAPATAPPENPRNRGTTDQDE